MQKEVNFNTSSIANIIRLLSAIIVAILIALGVIKYCYKLLPGDFARTEMILKTLQSGITSDEDFLVFGSSIAMAGVDTRVIGKNTNANLHGYNMSSTGQLLQESMLFYTSIPDDIDVVVQCIRVDALYSKPVIKDEVYQNFAMYDYQLDDLTKSMLQNENVEYFNKSRLKILLNSRSFLRDRIDALIRKVLRKDIDLDGIETDKYSPSAYVKRVSDSKYENLINKYNPTNIEEFVELDSVVLSYLQNANSYFVDRGIRYVIVINPVNPDLSNYTSELFKRVDEQLEGLNLEILNCSQILTNEDFVDHWHPSPNGTLIMSEQIGKYLNTVK